jgi:formate dehydrogenase major subunit
VTEAMQQRKAKLVVVDPRFTRSASVADFYAPIRMGTDIAFLGGVINYLLTNDKIHHEYVKHYTDATFLTKEGFQFDNGFFSGYSPDKRAYDKATWGYQIGADGYVKVDESMKDPHCVYQQLKKHYARYTPEQVSRITGTPKDAFLKVCEHIAGTAKADKVMTILYALGWTQHSVGSQNIRTMAMIQLLLGNMGRPGGGVNALRGHANVQGITDMCLYSEVLPGYLGAPTDADATLEGYVKARAFKPLRPGQMSYWQNFGKFFVSLQKAWYGPAATKANDFAYDWLPKKDAAYDVMAMFEMMYQGRMNGFLVQGFNPLAALPNQKKLSAAFSKLKYLVVMDPLATETSEFWKNFGPLNDVDPAKIQTEVFRLPTSCFAEETGSFTNSGRVALWKEAALEPPGEAKVDSAIIARLFVKIRELYRKDGGKVPEPILNLAWAYQNAEAPTSDELLREISGKAISDVLSPPDPKHPKAPPTVLVPAGGQVAIFAQLHDDGSTSCGNWLYSGAYTQAGNMTARRSTVDPSGLGTYPQFGYSWPANRRILYNRASADPAGKPWDGTRSYMRWDGSKWTGPDVPDMRPDAAPAENVGPFIMNAEGVARLHAIGMAEGPFPEHYEPFENPVGVNLMCPANPKAVSNPAARVYKGDMEAFGKASEFPYAATTYRLTEHQHFWTKHSRSNAIVQPAPFVEIGEDLAKEKGLKTGEMVKVRSNRGEVKAAVVVTKRIKAFDVDGKKVHMVGIPIHWGFKGVTQNGYLANALTPYVGDANSQTPEFKAFLVNIEKA